MIQSFKSKETEKIWNQTISRKLPFDIQNTARRKLRIMNNAQTFQDLQIPPKNRLESLKGRRKGQYSIRINDQWRICFKWKNGNCSDVEITDYH
ncbi:MAG TPA: type II toxin-antitoxin system RelE/ParE family toxin [Candidatus Glassbacteria bacterium]|nr:type II toxin-antitoxin system RelE/ParE family toxin [Candidatus Glassbacteria bacterium]